MKDIEEIIDQIEEELDDATNYAWKAMHYKAKDIELSNTYSELARQELAHADMLCTQGERIVRMHKNSEHEEHKDMHTIWNWQHKKFMAKKQHIRSLMTSS